MIADSAGMIGIQHLLDILRFSLLGISDHVYKQLADLLLNGHPCNGILYPLDLLVIKIIRFLS